MRFVWGFCILAILWGLLIALVIDEICQIGDQSPWFDDDEEGGNDAP